MDAAVAPSTRSHGSREEGCFSLGFQSLLFTQFLTATADHTFRWFAVGIAKDYAAPDDRAFQSFVVTIGVLAFAMPCLIFAAPAGYLADRFSKRSVIVGCKIAELFILAFGLVGAATQNLACVFITLALLGTLTTLFAPAKVGAIPEILAAKALSQANGLFQLFTLVAMVAGTVLGSYLADVAGHRGTENLVTPALTFLGIGLAGVLISLGVGRLPQGDPHRKFPWNAPKQTWNDIAELYSQRPLFRVALGILFFYAVGTLAQLNIDQLAAQGGAATESAKSPLLVALIFGVSAGAILAGYWSGDRVELGILPLGAIGVALSAMLMFTVPTQLFETATGGNGAVVWACILLFGLGVSAGLFLVPLEAYLQHHSDPERRGSIFAASNFLTCLGTLATSMLFLGLAKIEGITPRHIFLITGAITIPVFLYIVWLIPQASIRFLVWLASATVYRTTILGRENLPERGGAVLAPNHVTYVDAVLLMLTSSRPIRVLAWSGNFEGRWREWLAKTFGAILVHPSKPKLIVAALREARQAVADGEIVCIFPEGQLTRTGELMPFKPGLLKILDGHDAPVIPVYLDGLWGSIFSFEGGRFFWKFPRKFPYPVTIKFGRPLTGLRDVDALRAEVAELGVSVAARKNQSTMNLPSAFIRQCKHRSRIDKSSDSTGASLTGGELLLRTLILRRLLRRNGLQPDEKYVGLLLPPSVPGVVANTALTLDGRIVANLNYTTSVDVMNACIRHAGIKHVVTSRRFLSKMPFDGLEGELIYLEDLKDKVTLADKVAAAFATYVMPAGMLERSLGLHRLSSDDVAAIIFTSGSTGTPKGVMVTHGNLQFNVESIRQAVRLQSSDVILGVLPFFHIFGYTVSLWAAASLDIQGTYHYSPLDARQIGKLCKERKGTILLATPTFLRTYLRRCEPEDFATLDVVVTGAEKLPSDVSAAFLERFKVQPVEGFGATETTPLVSVNIPPSRSSGKGVDCKPGKVGRPVPGCTVRIVSLDSGEPLPVGEAGMVQVRGPNVMKGYLHRQDLTDEVIRDGWYITGDVGLLDEDGFLQITGRQSRFSKIGGEMVPHIKIEEAINAALGAGDDEMKAAVTAVSHEKKGERLIVLHTKIDRTPEQIRKALTEAGLPNLFLPANDAFYEVEKIPVLGTGKLDLKALKATAEKLAGEE